MGSQTSKIDQNKKWNTFFEEPTTYADTYMCQYENSGNWTTAAEPRTIKIERVSPSAIQKRRPGPLPARADNELDGVEFDRRQRRRELNRHAAARCRTRRINKVQGLEAEIEKLRMEKVELNNTNINLKKELENLQMQLRAKNRVNRIDNCEPAKPAIVNDEAFPALKQLEHLQFDQNYAVTFTPLLAQGGTSFNFPPISKDTVEKIRNQSMTEFNKILNLI